MQCHLRRMVSYSIWSGNGALWPLIMMVEKYVMTWEKARAIMQTSWGTSCSRSGPLNVSGVAGREQKVVL